MSAPDFIPQPEMHCEVCQRSTVADGLTLYRVNLPGVMPSRWRCRDHLTVNQVRSIAPQVLEIVKALRRLP